MSDVSATSKWWRHMPESEVDPNSPPMRSRNAFMLPECTLRPADGSDRARCTHIGNIDTDARMAEGLVSRESSVITDIAHLYHVYILCTSEEQAGLPGRLQSEDPTRLLDLEWKTEHPHKGWNAELDPRTADLMRDHDPLDRASENCHTAYPADLKEHPTRWNQSVRVFGGDGHVAEYPSECTLATARVHVSGTMEKVTRPCSVKLGILSLTITRKPTDLGRSFKVKLDDPAAAPTSCQAESTNEHMDVYTDWMPATFEGDKGTARGAVRSVYRVCPVGGAIPFGASCNPQSVCTAVAGVLTELESNNRLNVDLNVFHAVNSDTGPTVDYKSDFVGTSDVSVTFRGTDRDQGTPVSCEVYVTSQCKFDH